jgi:hypothetical protein
MSNHTDTTVSASGGDATTVDNSVQGVSTESEKAVPEDKAPNRDVKHNGMEKA